MPRFKFFAPLLMVFGLSGCSALGMLDAVMPKDSGSHLAASDIQFGPDARQKLDVYVPDRPGRHDVLVFVYGGSWSSGDRREYAFAGRAFAAKGYVTILFDYRLVPQHPYPDFVADTAAAVAWASRNAGTYSGNGDRVFLVGHSAGAYNAAMVGLAPEFLEAAGVSPSVLKGFAGISGPYDFLPLDTSTTRATFGYLSGKALEDTQPVNRVAQGRPVPPAFLATGDADTTVRPRNTERLARRLRDTGHRVEEKHYAGAGHAGMVLALGRPFRGKAPVLDDIVAFFRKL